MATKFDDYISEVEERAKAGGPEALARWDAFNAHYTMAREVRLFGEPNANKMPGSAHLRRQQRDGNRKDFLIPSIRHARK